MRTGRFYLLYYITTMRTSNLKDTSKSNLKDTIAHFTVIWR